MAEKTPMRRQYEEIKSRYPDCMLLFRLGDFYEMFDEDAQTAADELDLMLTTRDRNKPPEEQTPMCGVPYHAANSYIKKLIDHGHKVAVCDQLEDPALTKGLVKRDVIRVITPGTVTDEGMLDYERPNYLCALWLDGRRGGAAFCDVSTGEFCAADFPDFAEDHTLNELTRFSPNEAVLSAGAAASRRVTDFITTRVECMYQVEDAGFEYAAAERQLLHHFGVSSLEELGLAGCEGAVRASGALLGYIGETQKCDMKHISRLDLFEGGRYMELDYATRRSLELTETMRSGEKSGSLLGILDFTKTPMGGRLLRSWLERPLLSVTAIAKRNAAVAALVESTMAREELIAALTGLGDMERLIGRIVYGTAGGRDMVSLRSAIERLPALRAQLAAFSGGRLAELAGEIGSDVGFFIYGMACRCTGRGEKVEPLPEWREWRPWIVLLKPSFGVSTPDAYRRWAGSRELPGIPYGEQRVDGHVLVNDLERPVFEKHLFLAEMKRWLLERPGVRGAMMSGSGSTMFAVAEDEEAACKLMEDAARELDPTLWMWSGLVMREGAR